MKSYHKMSKEKDNLDKNFLSIFITSFTTIFIAELGDKTQLATLMLSAESGRPLVVFIGSSFALLCSSIAGVLIGKWLSSKISREKLLFFTGLLMTMVSIWIGYTIYEIYN
tara:strand:- start:629 stop:961 length:333 start_codon:yes stop_codon:yes gene_type:complete